MINYAFIFEMYNNYVSLLNLKNQTHICIIINYFHVYSSTLAIHDKPKYELHYCPDHHQSWHFPNSVLQYSSQKKKNSIHYKLIFWIPKNIVRRWMKHYIGIKLQMVHYSEHWMFNIFRSAYFVITMYRYPARVFPSMPLQKIVVIFDANVGKYGILQYCHHKNKVQRLFCAVGVYWNANFYLYLCKLMLFKYHMFGQVRCWLVWFW